MSRSYSYKTRDYKQPKSSRPRYGEQFDKRRKVCGETIHRRIKKIKKRHRDDMEGWEKEKIRKKQKRSAVCLGQFILVEEQESKNSRETTRGVAGKVITVHRYFVDGLNTVKATRVDIDVMWSSHPREVKKQHTIEWLEEASHVKLYKNIQQFVGDNFVNML